MTRTNRHCSSRIPIFARSSLLVLLLAGIVSVAAAPTEEGGVGHRAGVAAAGALPPAVRRRPLAFEANRGQTDPQVRFLARGLGYTIFLTPSEAVLALQGHGPERAVVHVKPIGASETPRVFAEQPLPGLVHYARVPTSVPIDAPTYASVRYAGLYPGVDLVYYGLVRQLEYDFVVAPGADPTQIVLAFEGAEGLEVAPEGDLVLHTAAGDLRQPRPVAYQEVDGVRRPVRADYALEAEGRVRLHLGAYDAVRALVIDPVLVFSTYLGGSNDEMDWLWGAVFGIAVDADGNS